MNRRIFRVIVVVTLLAIVAFGVPLAIIVRQLARDEAVVRLERETAQAALQIDRSSSLDPDDIVAPAPAGDARFTIYDRHGVRLAGDGPSPADAVVRAALSGRVADGTAQGQLAVALPITAEGHVDAVVRAARPLGPLHTELIRDWSIMAGLAAVILIAAIAAARREASRLARPVEQLAVAVTRLGDGDFTAHARRSGVPEIDEAADALDATAERLGRMVERERSFSADASHQLRTPLTGMRLRLENALASSDRDHTEAITDALAAVDRLEETVIDLLELARGGGLPRQPVQLADVLARVHEQWAPAADRQGRALEVAAEDELPPVRVSEPAVRQILDVLVDNALVHGAGTVTMEARAITGGVTVDVVDEGPGVGGHLDEVFERHRGAHHGIGLALARSLAEAEGGRLLLRAPGPRPRFSLVLTGPHE